jgi:hypothetical protein
MVCQDRFYTIIGTMLKQNFSTSHIFSRHLNHSLCFGESTNQTHPCILRSEKATVTEK